MYYKNYTLNELVELLREGKSISIFQRGEDLYVYPGKLGNLSFGSRQEFPVICISADSVSHLPAYKIREILMKTARRII